MSHIYVSFAKEPYKRDNILQKRPTILRSALIVVSIAPYHSIEKIERKREREKHREEERESNA